MKTPLCDFLADYEKKGTVRLHMPGHKGRPFTGPEPMEITEIDGADVLYREKGVLAESQNNASLLFSSAQTLYSTEGCTLPLRAMLFLACLDAKRRGEVPRIAAQRGSHTAFLTAAALLDFEILWLEQEGDALFAKPLTAERLSSFLQSCHPKPCAVYFTSPDYLGTMADLSALCAVCRENGVLSLVDNAHGAYLAFVSPNRHPLAQGADMVCDSAHKTLPVLTGGAYLHLSRALPDDLCAEAKRAMLLFSSTSPSYLVLQSLDRANAILSSTFPCDLKITVEQTIKLKEAFEEKGIPNVSAEPLKITLAPKAFGYTGNDLATLFSRAGIIPEYSDPDYLVMMFSPALPADTYERILTVLHSISRRPAILTTPPPLPHGVRMVDVREAMLSPSEEIDTADCLDRVLASPCVACPPAIPIAVCGERLDETARRCFDYYGIKKIRVLCS